MGAYLNDKVPHVREAAHMCRRRVGAVQKCFELGDQRIVVGCTVSGDAEKLSTPHNQERKHKTQASDTYQFAQPVCLDALGKLLGEILAGMTFREPRVLCS